MKSTKIEVTRRCLYKSIYRLLWNLLYLHGSTIHRLGENCGHHLIDGWSETSWPSSEESEKPHRAVVLLRAASTECWDETHGLSPSLLPLLLRYVLLCAKVFSSVRICATWDKIMRVRTIRKCLGIYDEYSFRKCNLFLIFLVFYLTSDSFYNRFCYRVFE